MLCFYGYSLPAYQKLNRALLVKLETDGVGENGQFFEYLDLLHIQDEQQRQALVDMLRAKYTKLGIDLLVILQSPAMSLMLRIFSLESLWCPGIYRRSFKRRT